MIKQNKDYKLDIPSFSDSVCFFLAIGKKKVIIQQNNRIYVDVYKEGKCLSVKVKVSYYNDVLKESLSNL